MLYWPPAWGLKGSDTVSNNPYKLELKTEWCSIVTKIDLSNYKKKGKKCKRQGQFSVEDSHY